ncbi:MAG: hypothetical protein AAF483_23200 [Planctomycetota bacterium]
MTQSAGPVVTVGAVLAYIPNDFLKIALLLLLGLFTLLATYCVPSLGHERFPENFVRCIIAIASGLSLVLLNFFALLLAVVGIAGILDAGGLAIALGLGGTLIPFLVWVCLPSHPARRLFVLPHIEEVFGRKS